ncbi:hypothetical protein HDU83_004997 [Entophlyctis luteolus]|nr:hypothetical protein HDU83_004997 [Entophlyctis luteolus]
MNGHGHFNEQLDRIYFLLMHMVGTKVSVTTKDNAQFEGILHTATANSDFGVVLKMARQIIDGKPASDARDSLVIFPKDLIALSCVELEVANDPSNAGGSNKDSSIGSRVGEFGRERELVQWSTDEADTTHTLESSGGLAGEKWDQFATNEKLFGVQTDFQEEMYTTVIDKTDPQFKKKEAEAIRLAKEMESEFGKTDNSHMLEERNLIIPDDGSNEEEKYSSVIRKSEGSSWRARPASFAVPDSTGSKRESANGELLKQKPELVPISTKADPVLSEGSLSTAPASTKPSTSPDSPLVKRSKSPGHSAQQKSSAAPTVTTTVNAVSNKPTITAAKSFAVKTGFERKEELLNKLPVKVAVDAVQTRDPVGDTFQKFQMFAERERKQVKRPLRDAMAKPKPEIISELKAFSTSFKLPMPFPSDLKEIIKKSPDESSAQANADSPKETVGASLVRGNTGKSLNKPASYLNERSASEVVPPLTSSPSAAAVKPTSVTSSNTTSNAPQSADKEKSKFKFNLSAVEFTPLGGASPSSQSQNISRSGSGSSAPKGPVRNNSSGYNKGYQKNGAEY